MTQKLTWLGLLVLTALAVYLAYLTDVNYLTFVRGTDRVQIVVRPGKLNLGNNRATIDFTVQVSNPSRVKLWVEAVNYKISVNSEYAGYQYMPEGEIPVPPGGQTEIPLKVELRADYLKLLLSSLNSQQETLVNISGRARMKFDIGRSGLKAFYPFGGIIWQSSPSPSSTGSSSSSSSPGSNSSNNNNSAAETNTDTNASQQGQAQQKQGGD